MQYAHLDAGETCFFNKKAACAYCDIDDPEQHKVAAGGSKFVVHGFVPVTEGDKQLLETEKYFETLEFPVISKFEIRKRGELVNGEDRMLEQLQVLSDGVVPKTLRRVPNYALTENERENMIRGILEYSERFKKMFSRLPFWSNTEDGESLRHLQRLLHDARLQEIDVNGYTHILVRCVEEDCGTSLFDYMIQHRIRLREASSDAMEQEAIFNEEATVVNDLRTFIRQICKIIRGGFFHFDVKDDNVTCKVDQTGHMTLKTIDWGYGHMLTPVRDLRSFALQVPQDFSFFLKAEAMSMQQDWKPPEFSMFWLLCWLISYNFDKPDEVSKILHPDFTFTDARNKLYSCLRRLQKTESMKRFRQWHMYYRGVVQKNMWELVHANFTQMFYDSDLFCRIPNAYLPVIPDVTNGSLENFTEYLATVGEHFFPPTWRLMNVIRYDPERRELMVNWKFIFRECHEIIHASQFSPELPDFVMSLFLKVFYLRNDANSSQNEVNFVRGEEMLSQRMDCWGYAVIFTEFSRIRLSRYDPNLRKWWVMVLNNPFTSLQNLELIIGDYYWPKILHGEVSPEHIARQILPSLFQNVMTPPITQDLSDVQAGASQHPAPFTGVQNPQWLRLSEHRHYQFEYGADMRGLSRLFGDPRQNPYLNTPSHEQPLSFYIPSTLNTTIRPGDRPRGPSARGGSSGSPRTYEARTGHPSSVQNVDASALRNSSIPQTLPPSPDWNARGGSAGAPGTNDAARRNSGIPPPPRCYHEGCSHHQRLKQAQALSVAKTEVQRLEEAQPFSVAKTEDERNKGQTAT